MHVDLLLHSFVLSWPCFWSAVRPCCPLVTNHPQNNGCPVALLPGGVLHNCRCPPPARVCLWTCCTRSASGATKSSSTTPSSTWARCLCATLSTSTTVRLRRAVGGLLGFRGICFLAASTLKLGFALCSRRVWWVAGFAFCSMRQGLAGSAGCCCGAAAEHTGMWAASRTCSACSRRAPGDCVLACMGIATTGWDPNDVSDVLLM